MITEPNLSLQTVAFLDSTQMDGVCVGEVTGQEEVIGERIIEAQASLGIE